MASFTLEEICKTVDGRLYQRGVGDFADGVSTDTRSLTSGSLFIALSGERFDGHRFVKNAVEKGAAAVVVSNADCCDSLPSHVPVIVVGNTRKALEDLACFHRMRFSVPVIAVTGSNGKTTTKDMIADLLSVKYPVCKTQKNFNNEIGLSMTLLSMTEKEGAAVVEMGMRGSGQIAELCRIARPTVGVVTNVGPSHLGILGSMEEIAKAKSELVEALGPEGTAILNEDDPYVKQMVSCAKGRVIGYGVEGSHTVQAVQIKYEPEKTHFICTCFDETFHVNLHLLGIHNVYNALAAAATARLLGVNVRKIQKALSEFYPEDQRQMILHIGGVSVMDDSYNANPLSMEMSFHSLKQMGGRRRILVLGDMMELGPSEKEFHYQIGEKAADLGFDKLITVGSLSHYTAEGARRSGLSDVTECSSCAEAAHLLAQEAETGDVVLIKGSHSMQMETIPVLWREELDCGH